ncbi:hypothetical protein HBF26_17110 [Luteibacter jiangsuensis]|uniref:Uncharacterized protein n=1 Tax=Luteibacter jiangsuensis TaxID=637577 RepID=A0ABX0QAV6_9GAMM|nr:hypothetical protein [Luteibacter jiangsuensis]NID06617.1 hypothetical protein [Luteibacter jiangsuensis]
MDNETQRVDVCPHCRLPIEADQPSKWWAKSDSFGFKGSRAPTRRYRVHRVCPSYYSKQVDEVNDRYDDAVAKVAGNDAVIAAMNIARASELAQIESRAALARVGGAA